jgi:hypothetical protein
MLLSIFLEMNPYRDLVWRNNMMRSALLSLIFVSFVYADGPSVTAPPRVAVEVGRLAIIDVTYAGTDFKYLADKGLDVFREYVPDSTVVRLRAQGFTPGTYNIVYMTCSKEGKLAEWVKTAVIVGGTPGPGPGPGPNPPDPSPLPPITSAYVLIIEETSDASALRGTFFTDKDIAAWFAANPTWKYKVVDKDIKDPNTGQTPEGFKPWLAKVQGKKLPQMIVIDQDGNVRYQGPVPMTPAEFLNVLKGIK